MSDKEDKYRLYQHWLSEIETKATRLTTWEEDFVQSIKSQLEEKGGLSPKQAEVLERIYVEKV